jgi:hypothetical protein
VSSTSHEKATDDAGMATYLDAVRREIDDEVRQRRAAGDFPLSFERRLDELFDKFTPITESDSEFAQAMKVTNRAALIDVSVPTGSRRHPRGAAKFVLRQAEAWFISYVVDQINHFNSSIVRTSQLLDDRLAIVEREFSLLAAAHNDPPEIFAAPVDIEEFAGPLLEHFQMPGAPGGPVLHAESTDGSLVAALVDGHLDAYGVDPSAPVVAAARAARPDLDVRLDEVMGHLEALDDDSLGGLILSGAVDRFALSDQRHLLTLSERKLKAGAALALITTAPHAWLEIAGPLAADLAPGRPLHPETWRYLLKASGFAESSINTGAARHLVAARKPAAT